MTDVLADTMDHLFDEFPEHLKCPICYEVPQDKVIQCMDGHVICEKCFGNLVSPECPQCRLKFNLYAPRIRNRFMEGLLDEVEIKCPHNGLGCVGKFNRKTIKQHVYVCTYSPFRRALYNPLKNNPEEPKCITWVARGGGLWAPYAVRGGVDANRGVFVIRAYHEGGLVVGKLIIGTNCALIPFGCKEIEKKDYEVLTAPYDTLSWVPNEGFNIPTDAVEGGKDPFGYKYYIGRVQHNNTLTVGKVQNSMCYIGYDGKEHAYHKYEILVRNALGKYLNV